MDMNLSKTKMKFLDPSKKFRMHEFGGLKVLQEEKQKQLIGKQNFGIKLEIKY
jgi:hypothetical protein